MVRDRPEAQQLAQAEVRDRIREDAWTVAMRLISNHDYSLHHIRLLLSSPMAKIRHMELLLPFLLIIALIAILAQGAGADSRDLNPDCHTA